MTLHDIVYIGLCVALARTGRSRDAKKVQTREPIDVIIVIISIISFLSLLLYYYHYYE